MFIPSAGFPPPRRQRETLGEGLCLQGTQFLHGPLPTPSGGGVAARYPHQRNFRSGNGGRILFLFHFRQIPSPLHQIVPPHPPPPILCSLSAAAPLIPLALSPPACSLARIEEDACLLGFNEGRICSYSLQVRADPQYPRSFLEPPSQVHGAQIPQTPTLHPNPQTLDLKPQTLLPKPLEPYTTNLKLQPLNSSSVTLDLGLIKMMRPEVNFPGF